MVLSCTSCISLFKKRFKTLWLLVERSRSPDKTNQIKTIKQIELANKQPEKTTFGGSMKTLLKIDSHGAGIRLRTNREWIWPKDDFRFDIFGYITVIRMFLHHNLQQNQCTKHLYEVFCHLIRYLRYMFSQIGIDCEIRIYENQYRPACQA